MTLEEKFNLAQFLRLYVEKRVELIIHNAVKQLDNAVVRPDDTVTFTFAINLAGSQLELILNGELDPATAVKLLVEGKTVYGDHIIKLDKEPQQ